MNDITTFVINPIIYSSFAYWGLSAFWFLLDVYVAPYGKIPGGENINWVLYKKTALHVAKLHSITPFILYLIIPLWKLRGIDTSLENAITYETITKVCLCPLLGDVVFYIGHRIGHLSNIYKTVHKKHHEWVVPVAVAASYATFYEYIFFNLPVFLLPPMILNVNWYGANVWFIFSTINVVNDHSGYTFLSNSVFHANHHKQQKYNYGFFITDSLGNTRI